MKDISNYYQQDINHAHNHSPERFPDNHVAFSMLLKPVTWIDRTVSLLGVKAFKMKDVLLKEFDRAAPLDEYLGSRYELNNIRNLILSYGRGLDNNPYISAIGRFLLKTISLNMLKLRRKVLRYYHLHRDYIESNSTFNAPVIITGLPRSGSTLLHRLLSEDPHTRAPYTFEMETPIPPMISRTDPMKDPRIKDSTAAISLLSRLAPGFLEKLAESHLWSATEREESLTYMLGHNGVNVMNKATAGMAYMNDLYTIDDKRPIFRYERLFFTMLDAYGPAVSHWTLKAPIYAPYFPLIFATYPDARVVLTHRNPIVTMPSYCRLMESWCIAMDQNGTFDKHGFGRFEQRYIHQSLMVPMTYRKDHPEKESQLFDCMYEDLFKDPIAMVKTIYEKFNLTYTQDFEQNMIRYLKNNRQGKYGRHSYSLEEYGFKAAHVYKDCEPYMVQYGFDIPQTLIRPDSFDFSLG